jgi:hypothetical protein
VSLIVPWIVFPLVLGLLSLGCGLLLERVAGIQLPRGLLLPVGYALMVVVGVLVTTNDTTARLTAPLIVSLAVAGLALALPWRLRSIDGWAGAAGASVFAAYGAPIFMSGRATFPGYIELDDTSTWLAFTDRLMTHGRTLVGLPPSTYQAALEWYWHVNGYPVGAYPPLGVGHELVRTDSAWLIQPYIAFVAALLAFGLYELLRRLIPSRPLRTFAAFIAAQPAILYGYSLWGGSKEVPAAALLALIAALTPQVVRQRAGVLGLLPLATASAAMVEILNFGGAVWLVPVLLPGLVAGVRLRGRRFGLSAAAFGGIALLLALPPLVSASGFLNVTSKFLTNESELGNLIRPLSGLQLFGIWPAGDFRVRPGDIGLTYVLVAVVIASSAAGAIWAWKRGAWELPLYLVGAGVGCAIAVALGSPWIDAKALAIASPAFVVAAMAGAGWLVGTRRVVEGAVVTALIGGGVLWSNALAYHDVWLAPRSQLGELEKIGSRFPGDGPTLMTEYQPFGVRHFLRNMDPEATSELRTRVDPLRNGQQVPTGEYADLDRLALTGVLAYRTLVLPNTPSASRPPSVYRLVWSGRFYDVWQRPEPLNVRILDHLALGTDLTAAAVPRCAAVLRLARQAAAKGGRLAAVIRPQPTVVALSTTEYPATWHSYSGSPDVVYPARSGTLTASLIVSSAGRYGLWLGGSFRRQLEVSVDGHTIGTRRHQLNHPGDYTPFGKVDLAAGRHVVTLRYRTANLLPGSGGPPFALGPLVVARHTEELPVTYLQPSDARTLCGRSLDWVEAIGS